MVDMLKAKLHLIKGVVITLKSIEDKEDKKRGDY
tara:strand:+ start:120 stop:221 length:102 start_codon:yes stop_codon:yes gene_type:complete